MRTNEMDSLCEWFNPSIVGIERHGCNLICPIAQSLRLKQRPHGKGAHVLRSVEQRQSFLARQYYRLPALAAKHLGTSNHLALILHLAKSYEREAQMSKRHKVT